MGASSGGASAQLILAFFIAWIIIFPLVFVVPRKLAFWFNARSIIGPIVYFALFGWCAYLGLHKPRESFPGFSFQQTTLATSSAKAWAFLSGVNSIVASIAPQCSNVSDITRYASRPKAAGWPQGAAFFATKVSPRIGYDALSPTSSHCEVGGISG
jgi:nucleobase:cation symporter-1, NCS1 family